MQRPECDHLDDYLGGWLSQADRTRFAAHLADCPACREECQQQRQIDRLLRQGAGRDEPAPRLIEQIERQIHRASQRRRLRWACVLSAAATIALAVGVFVATRDRGNGPQPPPMTEQPDEPAAPLVEVDPPEREENAHQPPKVRVVASRPAEAIVVPVKTEAPNVSIVLIYPTVTSVQAAPAPDPFD